MPAKFQKDGLNLTRKLLDYVMEATVVESPHQIKIREETAANFQNARMMISPVQGQAMRLLLRTLRPKRLVEVGVFTGYSATWMLEALVEGGTLATCELNEDYLKLAQSYWAQAGFADAIRPLLGPGAQGMQTLLDDGWGGTVDGIFIDADKVGYPVYYEKGYALLRPGGMMLFDNVLWGGSVADPENTEKSTVALRQVAQHAAKDPRVDAAILTDGDGLLAVFKH